jgi:BlaI family penicillinase repressor
MATPRIADAEWIVMEFAWEQGAFTTADAVAALATANGWSEPTIKTMIRRLVEKQALTAEPVDGRRFRYRAKVRREACAKAQTKGLAERLFAGAAGAGLLVHLVRDTRLSREDIAALRQALADKEQEVRRE